MGWGAPHHALPLWETCKVTQIYIVGNHPQIASIAINTKIQKHVADVVIQETLVKNVDLVEVKHAKIAKIRDI